MTDFHTKIIRRKRPLVILGVSAVLVATVLCAASKYWVHSATSARVYKDIAQVPKCRVALVLGAKVYPGGRLSPILSDRVDKAIELYKAGKVKKLLMSGDNRVIRYNEPQRMAEYAIQQGIPAADVSMDFAGRRTYDSVYRARHVFGLNQLVVVSQSCHAERAIFLCDRLGIRAHGVSADVAPHLSGSSGLRMAVREFPACLAVLVDTYIRRPVPMLGKAERI